MLGCLMLFLMLAQRGSAVEQSDIEAKAVSTQPITFQVKRDGQKYVLENVNVEKNFGNIGSVEIEMPVGVKLNMEVPSSWSSSNDPNSPVISYQIDPKNTPQEVENVLKGMNFSIQKEDETQGEITITLSVETISSWQDPAPGGVKHYYKFVPKIVSWLDAYNEVKGLQHKGLTGYLATITSKEEHEFIFSSIAKNPGWLGGTRLVRNNLTTISDEDEISNKLTDYKTDKDNWYWANGPEAGEIFFVGKKSNGTTPANQYSGWSKNEPNNGWVVANGIEYTLQFAKDGKKEWNDLPNVVEPQHTQRFLQGYYVEFSAYGNQVEIDDKGSYSAPLPQSIKVQYLDQDSLQPLAPEVTTGSVFSIGDVYTTVQQNIDGYDVTVPSNASGVYSENPITVTYYYSKQTLTFYLQQVVVDPENQIVIPIQSYTEIRNVDALQPADITLINEKLNVLTNSLVGDGLDYTAASVYRNTIGRYYQVEAAIPEYYQYMGYVLTETNEPHLFANKQEGIPIIDGNGPKEYWITFYVKPTTIGPLPYSWFYSNTLFGNIN
ncbi:MucBP domain-containing protein [Isobaculum melis]|uniref:MucBP domain-containing protein n=1 Tax=Isobaculum melis TaxID=142588 RepID=A0A1H9UE10_9LACT|nr:MucBP domain-containing protein [Isobaculum melis]